MNEGQVYPSEVKNERDIPDDGDPMLAQALRELPTMTVTSQRLGEAEVLVTPGAHTSMCYAVLIGPWTGNTKQYRIRPFALDEWQRGCWAFDETRVSWMRLMAFPVPYLVFSDVPQPMETDADYTPHDYGDERDTLNDLRKQIIEKLPAYAYDDEQSTWEV
jgi:hypothetical protein